jgi:hypothetical protein
MGARGMLADDGSARLKRRATVWIYVDTNKAVGDPDHLRTKPAADTSFRTNDPKARRSNTRLCSARDCAFDPHRIVDNQPSVLPSDPELR